MHCENGCLTFGQPTLHKSVSQPGGDGGGGGDDECSDRDDGAGDVSTTITATTIVVPIATTRLVRPRPGRRWALFALRGFVAPWAAFLVYNFLAGLAFFLGTQYPYFLWFNATSSASSSRHCGPVEFPC